VGRFKSRSGPGGRPGKGMRRSIRHDAVADDDPRDEPAAAEARPPEILLRQLRAAEALAFLEMMVDRHRRQGDGRVLVVHGKGLRSEGGAPVIAPLVRDWLRDNPDRVAAWETAPRRWGGEGALLVTLRR